jgi:hypothetical protein
MFTAESVFDDTEFYLGIFRFAVSQQALMTELPERQKVSDKFGIEPQKLGFPLGVIPNRAPAFAAILF